MERMKEFLKDYRVIDDGIWIPKKELAKLVDKMLPAQTAEYLIEKIDTDHRKHKSGTPEMRKMAKLLQERLMRCTIDFLKEQELKEVWSIGWYADDLQASVKEGSWCPASDSSYIGRHWRCRTGGTRIYFIKSLS